ALNSRRGYFTWSDSSSEGLSMTRQFALASFLAAFVIAGSVLPTLGADLPRTSTQAIEKAAPVKKSGRLFSTRVAAAEWSQVRTAWHRHAFPLVLGIAY